MTARLERAVTRGAELDALDGQRAVPDHRQHLFSRQHALDGPPQSLGGERGENGVRAGRGLRAEHAANERREHLYLLGW